MARLAYSSGRDPAADELAGTAALMLELLRRPQLLRFRSPDAVLGHLSAPDERARADAVRHVAYFGLDEAIPSVVSRLTDTAPLVREEALVTLTLLRVGGQRKRVVTMLDDDGGVVRLRALEYLARVVPDPPLDPMVRLAADADVWVARPAVRLLADGPHADAAALLERRTGGTVGRSWYAEVLGDDEEDFTVKTAVLNALQLVGNADDISALAAELRVCPANQASYAETLVKTISILIGRRIHGPSFGEEAER